jgi:hypothetical protein
MLLRFGSLSGLVAVPTRCYTLSTYRNRLLGTNGIIRDVGTPPHETE